MNFLKKLLNIDERTTRLDYLLFGIVPPILLVIIMGMFNLIGLMLFFPLLVWITLITTIKRGKDSGLNGIVTIILFFLIPTIILVVYTNIEVLRNEYFSYLSFSFILYLLVAPTKNKEIKKMSKWKAISLKSLSLIFSLAFSWSLVAPTCGGATIPLSKKRVSISRISMIETALNSFKLDNKTYPSTQEGLNSLFKNPNKEKYPNFDGSYLPKYLKDGWGSEFIYAQDGARFKIISYGADKKEGGEGENEDIVSFGIKK